MQRETALKLEYQSPAKPLQDISQFCLCCLRTSRPRAAAHAEGSVEFNMLKQDGCSIFKERDLISPAHSVSVMCIRRSPFKQPRRNGMRLGVTVRQKYICAVN